MICVKMAFSRLIFALFSFSVASIANNFKADTLEDTNFTQRGGQTLNEALKWLKVGERPSIFSQSKYQHDTSDRSTKVSSAFGNGPYSKFDIQYTFIKNVKRSSTTVPPNGFLELTSKSSFAKKYLVDMNLNIHGGNILPPKSVSGEEWNEFHEWLALMSKGQKQIILVDADSATLFKDIDTTEKNTSIHKTQHEHSFTLIQFKFNGTNVITEAMSLKGKLVIQMDQNGRLEHIRKPSSLPSNLWTKIALFTVNELKRIAEITQEIWILLPGRPRRDIMAVVNTQHPDYIAARSFYDTELSKICNGSWTTEHEAKNENVLIPSRFGICNPRISTTQGCAFFLNKVTDIVEEVDSAAFLKLYEDATEAERKEMLDMITNISSYQVANIGQLSKTILHKLVQHDKMRKQVSQLHSVNEVLEHPNYASLEPFRIFEKLQEKEVSNLYISPTRFATSLAHFKWLSITNRSTELSFLTETLISGIANRDVTSLNVLGRSLGLVAETKGAENFPPSVFNTAVKAEKAVRIIGSNLHPIGSVNDIAVSMKCLIDSMRQYLSATNADEGYNAVSSVINNTMDFNMGVRETVAGTSLQIPSFNMRTTSTFAFPNLLPLLCVENEVNRSNFSVFPTVFEAKQALQTEKIIRSDPEFLKNNTNVLGIMFPSRTMSMRGSCRLYEKQCHNMFMFATMYDTCRGSGFNVEIGRDCEINRPCPDSPCTDSRKENSEFTCSCGYKVPVPIFGSSTSDQYIDLRKKISIHHYRALPDNLRDEDFICKPGTLTFYEQRDYKTYQQDTTFDYRCENAVGIVQPWNRRHDNQRLLFMLGKGTDTVYLSEEDKTPTIFQIGDSGNKQFHGNGGENEFHFSGTCDQNLTGNLVGGQGKHDSISMNATCGKGETLLVDFPAGEMKFLISNTSLYLDSGSQYSHFHTRKQFKWTFSNVEEIHGRRGESDLVIVSCATKRVALRGGTKLNPDLVKIRDILGCKYNLTLLVDSFSTVLSNDTNGDITYLIGKEAEGITISTELSLNSKASYNVVFISLASKDFSSFEIYHNTDEYYAEVNLTINHPNNQSVDPVSFRLVNATNADFSPIYFTEEPHGSPKSVLYINLASSMYVYHMLSGIFKEARRIGSPIVKNIFEITNDSWTVVGGNLDDNIYLHTSALQNISIDGLGGINTLTLVESDQNDYFGIPTFVVNLQKGIFSLLHMPENEQSSIKNVHNLIGRPNKPEMFFANCSTKFIDGLGGVSLNLSDTIYISENGCNTQELSVKASDFTAVKNSAVKGEFTYFVRSFTTSRFTINVSHNNQHHFHYLFHPWQFVDKITFNIRSETICFTLLDSQKLLFNMTRVNPEEEYKNPTFQFQGSDHDSVVTTVGINKYGVVTATYLISGNNLSLQNDVIGISVDVNRFLINITETNIENPGCILGSNYSNANQFWIFNLKQPLQMLDGGTRTELSNYLHLDKHFEAGNSVIVELGENGYLASSNKTLIQTLKNIQVFQGRTSKDKDKVTLTCETRIVAEVEEIVIRQTDSCNYNLSIEVGTQTTIWFSGEKQNLHYSSNDVFNYRFQSPRSFDPQGDMETISWLTESNHNYIFPFKLDDLVSMEFDREEEKFCYLVKNYTNSGPLCHSMLKSLYITDQFYPQPYMITKDGFRIQINRVGDILLSSGAASSFPSLKVIQSQVIPSLEEISKRLHVTLILQTDKEYFHVGHDSTKLYRNVLQTVGIVTSHLVDAGQDKTIYEITSLENDVYIYSGLGEMNEVEDNDARIQQILMLTEVVMKIRMSTRTKYIPMVYAAGNDLVISMKPYEKQHPGRIIILSGISVFDKIQILLQNTMMSLHFNHERNEWNMKPKQVRIPGGALYYIAPEDLEDNQEILYDGRNNGDIKTNFTAFRNNTDLIITDMLGRRKTENDNISVQWGINYTTLVISSFFEDFTDPNASGKARLRRSPLNSVATFPRKISRVRINFPGLKLILQGTQVFISTNESDNLPLIEAKLENWKIELREAEKDLLHDVPSTLAQPIFQYDENYTDLGQSSIIGEVMLGLVAVLIIVIVLALIIVLRRRNIFPFSNQMYRSPTTVARINCQSDSNNDNGMELVEYRMEETPRYQHENAETCYELSVQKVTLTTYQISQNKNMPFSGSSVEK